MVELNWLNWSNGVGNDTGHVLTSDVVVSSRPLSLLIGPKIGDGSLVENNILGDLWDKSGWLGELLSPSGDGLHILMHGSAWKEVDLEVPDELLKVSNSLENVKGEEVGDKVVQDCDNWSKSIMAGTNLWQVVRSEHTVEESGNECRDSFKLEHELKFLHHLWNWSKGELNDLGSVTTGSSEIWSSKIGLELLDVVSELNWLLHDVLGHSSNEIFQSGVAFNVSLQAVNILSHALTVSEDSWKHSSEFSNVFGNLCALSSFLVKIQLICNWDGTCGIVGANLKL